MTGLEGMPVWALFFRRDVLKSVPGCEKQTDADAQRAAMGEQGSESRSGMAAGRRQDEVQVTAAARLFVVLGERKVREREEVKRFALQSRECDLMANRVYACVEI